ncbi:MAG: PepSY-associated TM helix domain-containing protein [Sideroxyarcus sp.]|nr:PepSY-associated TM helix domain-containing protein [Sideroxyarcus sp.]
MRSFVVFLHRWIGLLALVFLVVAAVTGTIITFGKELDRALNPEWNYVVPTGKRMPIDELVPRAQAQFPGSRVTHAGLVSEADRAYRFMVAIPSGDGSQKTINHTVFMNPYTGEVLGTRQNGVTGLDRQHIIRFFAKLHNTLFLGDFGKWLMGVIAVLWLLDHFGAVYLSFPNPKSWKKSFLLRWKEGGYKLNFDMHRAGSLWLLPLLLALALSSVYLNLKEPFKWIVTQFSPVTETQCACKVKATGNWITHTSSWDDAIAMAQQVKPDLVPSSITFFPDQAKLVVAMRGPDDIADSGMTKIYVNATNGQLLHLHDRDQETAGDTFLAWMWPLHTGRAFGLIGQILVCLSGILITVICTTGLVIYAKKARARGARKNPLVTDEEADNRDVVTFSEPRNVNS